MPTATPGHSSPSQAELPPRAYELRVLLLLGLAFGFAYFDRMAMTFLGPFVVDDLSLSKTEVGALGSGLSLTWALGAYFVRALVGYDRRAQAFPSGAHW